MNTTPKNLNLSERSLLHSMDLCVCSKCESPSHDHNSITYDYGVPIHCGTSKITTCVCHGKKICNICHSDHLTAFSRKFTNEINDLTLKMKNTKSVDEYNNMREICFTKQQTLNLIKKELESDLPEVKPIKHDNFWKVVGKNGIIPLSDYMKMKN